MKLPNLKGRKAENLQQAAAPRKPRGFSRLSMSTRRAVSGYLFILPFIIGFLVFMISPLIMSLQMTFSKVNSETINPNSFEMISYTGYDNDVTLSRQIDLPENLRYNEAKLADSVYSVELVSEVFTLDSSFSYGHSVPLSRQIELPNTVWYNPYDLAAGKYTVEPLENFMDLGTSLLLGHQVVLSEKIDLPQGYQYNKSLLDTGVYAVELSEPLLKLEPGFTFGKQLDLGKEIPLPEGYRYLAKSETGALAEGQEDAQTTVIVAENGGDIPLSFALHLFDSGLTNELSAAVNKANPKLNPRINKTSYYDEPLYKATGELVIRADIAADFAVYLLDEGHLNLFAEAIAAAKGLADASELGLPEYFTYDKNAYAGKKQLIVRVAADESVPVPTSFAAYLLDQKHADLFYETVDVLANARNVCFLYDPEYDDSGRLTGIGELPEGITYNASTFSSTGVMDIRLSDLTVPASFATHLMSTDWGLFFSTVPDLFGWENYVHVLTIEPTYNQLLVDEITKMTIHTVAILVVAFVIAILLNQEFKGRALVRAIFFLPVILSSGVLVNLEANNSLMAGIQDLISEETPFTVTDSMMEILRLSGIGGDLLDIVFDLIAEVYDIVMASGIQIIVFLSGLQNVPASLYEAADVEGCTKWEAFWMITFPLVSPLLIVNIIYTIIDFFTKIGNDLTILQNKKLLELKYDQMSTMSWIYFAVALAIIGVSAFIVSKVVASDE